MFFQTVSENTLWTKLVKAYFGGKQTVVATKFFYLKIPIRHERAAIYCHEMYL